jgi:beta-lactam-binding protein with PASTA domain
MTREAWEEVSFQVFTDEDGVLRSGFYPTGNGIVQGNVAVGREWGNSFPIQPNTDRGVTSSAPNPTFGGGLGDNGWAPTELFPSVQLDPTLNDHAIVTSGYSGYPEFVTMPRLVGDSYASAMQKLAAIGASATVTVSSTGATLNNTNSVKSQNPVGGDGYTASAPISVVLFDLSGVQDTKTPDLAGLTSSQATALLTAAFLNIGNVTTTASGVTGSNVGLVKSQNPSKNTTVDRFTNVDVVLYASNQVTVPNVVGFDWMAAGSIIASAGLTASAVGTTSGANASNANLVSSQAPSAGAAVSPGSTVTIYYYDYQTVPNVVGLMASTAINILYAESYMVTQTTTADGTTSENVGTVKSQTPAAGTALAAGNTVDITVYVNP